MGDSNAADRLDIYQKRYRDSEKGKEAERRYKESEKGKEAVANYRSSDKWYLAQKKYRLSEKGKAAIERRKQFEEELKTMKYRKENGLCVGCGASPNGVPFTQVKSYLLCGNCNPSQQESPSE